MNEYLVYRGSWLALTTQARGMLPASNHEVTAGINVTGSLYFSGKPETEIFAQRCFNLCMGDRASLQWPVEILANHRHYSGLAFGYQAYGLVVAPSVRVVLPFFLVTVAGNQECIGLDNARPEIPNLETTGNL